LSERGLVMALILLTAAYAIAEEITLTTYYPAPRGVYEQVRLIDASGDSLTATTSDNSNNVRMRFQRARVSGGSPATVGNGDILGAIRFEGYSNGAYGGTAGGGGASATIRAEVDAALVGIGEAPPGRITFITEPSGVGVGATERMRIASNGNVGIGTGAANPDKRLDVQASSTTEPQVHIANPTNATGQIAGLRLSTASGWNVQLRTRQDNAWLELTDVTGTPQHLWNANNYQTTGNVNAGSITLGGVTRTTWPFQTIDTFTGGNDDGNETGYGSKWFTRMGWVKCSFANDSAGAGNYINGLTSSLPFAADGRQASCHVRKYSNSSGTRFAIMATCPDGQKLISGGGISYTGTINDYRTDNVLSPHPDTYQGFIEIPLAGGSTQLNFGPIPNGAAEGWVISIPNTGGANPWDSGTAWTLCSMDAPTPPP
jgi:hypothetical protein